MMAREVGSMASRMLQKVAPDRAYRPGARRDKYGKQQFHSNRKYSLIAALLCVAVI